VVCEPANADVTFSVTQPGIVSIGRTHEGIAVGGESVKSKVIEAKSGGQVISRLAVKVKPMREVQINFFFAVDLENSTGSTVLDEEKAILLTLRLNRVWRRQANVIFRLNRNERIEVAGLHPQLGEAARATFKSNAIAGEFNVFCVGGSTGGDCDVEGSVFVMADSSCAADMDGMAIAHAAGHFLGFAGPHPVWCQKSVDGHAAIRW